MRLRHLPKVVIKIQRAWRDASGKAYYQKLKYTASDIFVYNKERRRDTILLRYKGDYIKAKGGSLNRAIAKKYQEKKIMFAAKVKKLNPKFKVQNRVLIVSESSLYNVGGMTGNKIQRRIPFSNIESISLSPYSDNIFIVNVQNEHAYTFITPKKIEVISIIYDLMKENLQKTLTINFSDNIDYIRDKGKNGSMKFKKDPKLKSVKMKSSGSTLTVTVPVSLYKLYN
eukprot:TRINITY_DN4654_c0_g6_i1.p1 TRINITY_DN4654_c0_g6~~TRINITY_DN4654_c0_g6_i1.p1  ORF type:complete len:227 (+),score=63.68 TRINITY_DN4654_c0_g6_i1:53-733(+)